MNLTPEQKTILRNWIATQPDKDAGRLAMKLYADHVTAWHDYETEEPRSDTFSVKVEKELKQIATTYGITKTDTIGQAIAKITNDKDELIFRGDYLYLKTIDVTGSDTYTKHHHDPTAWSETIARSLGLPDGIGWKDIEQL